MRLNLGTGKGTSILQLLETIRKVTGKEVPHRFAEARAGDPPVLYADPGKARQILGWKAQADLEQIIETAWKWELKLAKS